MIKQKRKKNPNTEWYYLESLIEAIYRGNPDKLAEAIIYYKQGKKCEDCGNIFNECYCEYCEDCSHQRCLCDINYYNPEEVQKRAVQIAKKTLHKEQLQELKNEIFQKLYDSGLDDKDYEIKR